MDKNLKKSTLGAKALRLKEVKAYYKLKSERKFADHLGIPPTTLSSWYKRNMFDADIIFAKCGQINLDWLLTGEGDMLRSNMRVTDDRGGYTAGSMQARIPLIAIESFAKLGEEKPEIPDNAWYVVPAFNGADFLTTVSGNSMYPNYIAGDIIACKKLETENNFFQWNKVYVLDTNQGALLKRVNESERADHILLVSDNPDYKPFELHRSKIKAIAIVVGIIRPE